MDNTAQTLWTHYGCWRCPTTTAQSKRPLSAMNMSGWACKNNLDTWVSKVGILEFSLLLSKVEEDFLRNACSVENLSCWVTGLVIMTNRTKLMVPDEINVYRVGPVSYHNIILSPLGQQLAASTRYFNHGSAWVDALKFKSEHSSRRPVHPLAMIALQNQTQPMGTRPEISVGNFFATQMQAASISKTCQVHPCTFTRLGSSDNIYDYEQNRCVILPPVSAFSQPLTVKGAFMIAKLPTTLIHAVVGIVGNQCENKDIIICTRSSLVPMMLALEKSYIAYECITNRTEISLASKKNFRLALTTIEFCESHYKPLSSLTAWNRVIFLIGWPSPSASKFLRCKYIREESANNSGLFSCSIQLMLSLASDLPDDIANNPPNQREVSHILGLPEHALGDFLVLRNLLPERVLRIEDEQIHTKVLRYTSHSLNAPTREEVEEWTETNSGKYVNLLLGQLSSAGRDCVSVLPKGTSLSNFLKVSDEAPSTSYISKSIQSQVPKQCAICMDERNATAVTSCGHWYCPSCISRALRTGFKQCPVCREALPQKRDVVVSSLQDVKTSFLEELSLLLKDPSWASEKTIVLMSWGSTHERICRFMRSVNVDAVSWSGNAKQLQKNIAHFKNEPYAYLFADPVSLTLKWLELPFVKRFLVIHPLNCETMEVCCQLKDCLNVSPNALVVFLRNTLMSASIGDLPTCQGGIKTCPILLETKRHAFRSAQDSPNNSPHQIEVEPII